MKKTIQSIMFGCAALFLVSSAIGQTYNYTGSVQTFTAPATGTYQLEVWGASGGDELQNPTNKGGRGGYSTGELNLTAGATLYIYVGEQGGGCTSTFWQSTGGGGATDIRLTNGVWNNNAGLYSRIIVAGGGGGRHGDNYENPGSPYIGNDGGGLTSPNFTLTNGGGLTVTGSSQTSGGSSTNTWSTVPGSFGFANSSGQTNTCSVGGYNGGADGSDQWANGGAGGGWYGGCVSWPTGAGGSGYVLTSTSFKPVGYTPTAAYHMNNTQLIAGNSVMPNPLGGTMTGNDGNGIARITQLCTPLVVNVTPGLNVCEGDTVTISGTSTGTGTVTWDNGITNGVPFANPTAGVTTYTSTSTDGNDCVSQVTITVGVDPGTDVQVACDSYTWPLNSTTYTSSTNTPTVTLTSAAGCDSIVTLDLTINNSTASSDVQVACDSYTWPLNSTTYTSSTNTPTVTLTNAAGCDSVVTLDLTINNSNAGTDVQVACDSYTWALNSTTYTSSTNTPTVTLTNAAGCDSVVTLDLTINNSNAGTDVQVACDTFTWALNSTTYTSSTNTPTVTLTNAAGCDSVVTLDLTINNSNAGTDLQVACDSFSWSLNSTTYTSSTNTPTVTLTNAAGCDSVVTLDLTINTSTAGTDVQVACDTFTWALNSTTYTSSTNTPTVTLTNAAGCDSVVTLDLTINTSTAGTDVQVACDTFTWVLNSTTYTSSTNTPTVTLTNAAGCDSVVTLDLTINTSTAGTDVQVACDTYTWPLNSTTYTSSTNTPTVTLTNAAGCDSLVTLDLTINQSPFVLMNPFNQDSICETDGAVNLPAVTPAGGTYSGAGVSGNMFDPSLAGIGMHYVVYTYTDSITTCSTSDSSSIYVDACVGVEENINSLSGISVYPNPTQNLITINLANNKIANYTLFSIEGRIISQANNITDNVLEIDLSAESKGIYFLRIENDKSTKVFKVIKQ